MINSRKKLRKGSHVSGMRKAAGDTACHSGMWLQTPQKFSSDIPTHGGRVGVISQGLVRAVRRSHLRVLAVACLSPLWATFGKQERVGNEGSHSS